MDPRRNNLTQAEQDDWAHDMATKSADAFIAQYQRTIPTPVGALAPPSLQQALTVAHIKDIYEITGGPLIAGSAVPIRQDLTKTIELWEEAVLRTTGCANLGTISPVAI